MDFWRQLDIFDPNMFKGKRILLIGCGGIGSPVAICLAKMGIHNLSLCDSDVIESHNLPNQLYPIGMEGKAKVDALSYLSGQMSGDIRINRFEEMYPCGSIDPAMFDVIISGVDSMKARKAIWDSLKYQFFGHYIEGRMGGESFRIYTVQPAIEADVTMYEDTLYTDEEAAEVRCTAQAIIYNTFVIAGMICLNLRKILSGEKYHREIIMDLPSLAMIATA